ncbi:sensor histidine kinase [Pollutibacter soli]|uniref:sensor histidine kinase n=1 Tax=Pollutibacter soli TaxID=3034157 RepID=UPI003013773B
MKRILLILLIVACANAGRGELSIDSLKHVLSATANDTLKLSCAGNLADAYSEISPDSALVYAERELFYARKLGFRLNECYALNHIGYSRMNLGNYPGSLEVLLEAITIAEDPASERKILPDKYTYAEDLYATASSPRSKRLDKIARSQQFVGILYGNAENYEKEKKHHLISRSLSVETGNIMLQMLTDATLGRSYLYLHMPDSALYYVQLAYELSFKTPFTKYKGSILLNLARVYEATNQRNLANEYFRSALEASKEQGYQRGVVASCLALANYFISEKQLDSARYFMHQGLDMATQLNAPSLQLRSYIVHAKYFAVTKNSDSIVSYQNKIIKINDSLFSIKQAQLFRNIDFDEQQRQQQKKAAEQARENRLRIYGLLAGLTLFICVALILFRNNRNKQKAYALLEKQKQETDHQRQKAEQALSELKSTQAQLVHAEKMASLGELTAGIAHEIENPLNFINNFSEVNQELLNELKEQVSDSKNEQSRILFADIESNLQKIIQHGQRADAIVKAMLQHSRKGGTEKVVTDLNMLCDEYIRIAYHSFRSKNKDFNVNIKTDFDASLQKVLIVPQEIGKIILNLLNNAFFAVAAKSYDLITMPANRTAGVTVTEKHQPGAVDNYEPTIIVATKKGNGTIDVIVSDNGNGIPEENKLKVFQPFFTTRPAGMGTGLGLSLSFDIARAYGGEISVESEYGKGSTFKVSFPDFSV